MPILGVFKKVPGNGTVDLQKKKIAKDTVKYQLKQSLKASLGNGLQMREAVKLPPGEDLNEWLAMNTTEIYNSTVLCYGVISDYCTAQSCPQMTAGKFTFLWEDGKKYTKPTSLPAPEYVMLLMRWISETMDDSTIFVAKGPYPKSFVPTVKKIWKRLARVYFHIYYHHWEKVKAFEAEAHVNTCFKHFYFFATEFNLVPGEEMEAVRDLVKNLVK